jgi:hypothetical protein
VKKRRGLTQAQALRVNSWGEEMGFGEGDKAQHAQANCRWVGRDMGLVGSKFGARRQPVSQTGRRKVMVAKRKKERDGQYGQEQKKRPKKDPPDQKKGNRVICGG